jgi:hypothetical protein
MYALQLISEQAKKKLIQRNLKQYDRDTELTFLAYAMAMKLPCPDTSDVHGLVISYSENIEMAIGVFKEYGHIDYEDEKYMKELMEKFLSWRYAVASGDVIPSFIKGRDFFVDELSLITRYVDSGTLCMMSDNYVNATYLITLFCEVLDSINFGVETDDE